MSKIALVFWIAAYCGISESKKLLTRSPACYEVDTAWNNATIIQFETPVTEAEQCQQICKDNNACAAWTWTNANNHEIKEACFLFSNIGEKIGAQECISGPRSCLCSDNVACSSSVNNEVGAIFNVTLEETCQESCQNLAGCEYYTWYDSTEFPANFCVLLSSCEETYENCSGCFSGPKNCDAPPENELAIIVTGGNNALTSVDLLFNNGSYYCGLPNLPDNRIAHSQNGFVTCGGSYSSYTRKSCLTFVDGEWQQTHYPLLEDRYYFSSWQTSNHGIYLIGGSESSYTSEVIDADGNTESGFDLTDSTRDTCSIEDNDEDRVILTGGYSTLNKVSVFNKNGFVEQLPDLLTGRYLHACGFFINNDKNKVLLVAGGYNSDYLKSTETLIIGSASWQTAGSLPNAVRGIRGVSISNKIILTGGYSGQYLDTVLEFNQETRDWKLVGHLSEPRDFHAASVVPLNEAAQYCQPSTQMEKRKNKLKNQGQP